MKEFAQRFLSNKQSNGLPSIITLKKNYFFNVTFVRGVRVGGRGVSRETYV